MSRRALAVAAATVILAGCRDKTPSQASILVEVSSRAALDCIEISALSLGSGKVVTATIDLGGDGGTGGGKPDPTRKWHALVLLTPGKLGVGETKVSVRGLKGSCQGVATAIPAGGDPVVNAQAGQRSDVAVVLVPAGCRDPASCDQDGDGYAFPDDCDDADPAIHPDQPEVCGDGKDNNCNGMVDEGCACTSADPERDCYPPGLSSPTLSFPPCQAGKQHCVNLDATGHGTWETSCGGAVVPGPEHCDGVDQDCDGIPDPPSCGCQAGKPCYDGPPFTAGIGACALGTWNCSGQAKCSGEKLPIAEKCASTEDADCDGKVACADPDCDAKPCDDEKDCTVDDRCGGGTCQGTKKCDSPPGTVCWKSPGDCDPQGHCAYQPFVTGSPCDDGKSCTTGDHCDSGQCLATVSCGAPPDDCHASAGSCDLGGNCVYSVKADGASCDDGKLCSSPDTCQGGVCSGVNTCTTPPNAQCWQATGTCTTGGCTYAKKADGAACDDGNPCSRNDVCANGTCGGTAFTCNAPDACHSSTCNGVDCTVLPQAGGACSDAAACISAGTCDAAGACQGPVCPAASICQRGTCISGACSYAPQNAGAVCGSASCNDLKCDGSGNCTVPGSPSPKNTACSVSGSPGRCDGLGGCMLCSAGPEIACGDGIDNDCDAHQCSGAGAKWVCCGVTCTDLSTTSDCGGCGLACGWNCNAYAGWYGCECNPGHTCNGDFVCSVFCHCGTCPRGSTCAANGTCTYP
jgi:hypothetical protein